MFEILGYVKVSFTNKDTGLSVYGYNVYLRADEIDPSKGDGYICIAKFFSIDRICGELEVGAKCEFTISYNSKGEPKVTGLKVFD